MKKWIRIILTGILFVTMTTTWAKTDASFLLAQNQIENWFAAMKSEQPNAASKFLAPQFVSIHTDGIVRNKTQELKLIKSMHMKEYKLTDFQFSRAGNTLVVTYKDRGSELIDHKVIDKKPAGRMAVMQLHDGKWLILAYANLDQIG